LGEGSLLEGPAGTTPNSCTSLSCPACGTWKCNDCGATRPCASRFSQQPQRCAKCRGLNGQMGRPDAVWGVRKVTPPDMTPASPTVWCRAIRWRQRPSNPSETVAASEPRRPQRRLRRLASGLRSRTQSHGFVEPCSYIRKDVVSVQGSGLRDRNP
jgi:hypothetical protein